MLTIDLEELDEVDKATLCHNDFGSRNSSSLFTTY